MQQYLVFGGELKDPRTTEFVNPKEIDVVGIFDNYVHAYDAWRGRAQATIDSAHVRYFLIPFSI